MREVRFIRTDSSLASSQTSYHDIPRSKPGYIQCILIRLPNILRLVSSYLLERRVPRLFPHETANRTL